MIFITLLQLLSRSDFFKFICPLHPLLCELVLHILNFFQLLIDVFFLLVEQFLFLEYNIVLQLTSFLGSIRFTLHLRQLQVDSSHLTLILKHLSSHLVHLVLEFVHLRLTFDHAQAQFLNEVLQHHWHTLANKSSLELLGHVTKAFFYFDKENLHVIIGQVSLSVPAFV